MTVMSGGHWIVGGLACSITRTVNSHLLSFSQRSFAVQVTVVMPHGKKLPDGGTQVTATGPLLSKAVGGG